MPTYCTMDDVKARLPNAGIDANTKPSVAQVMGFIDLIDGELRGVIASAGYENDPIDASASATLRLYAAAGVASLTASSLPMFSLDLVKLLREEYYAGLAAIKEGNVAGLVVPAATGTGGVPSSLYTVDPDAVPDPTFRIAEQQW